ncbi:MAG: ARPP-1 family domain-containing protein [Terriglobales bacterium]
MSQRLLFRFGLASVVMTLACSSLLWGGNPNGNFKVLSPISHGNLTIFPVAASTTHDTSDFITLDEGIRSGEVVVTEAGRLGGLIRGPHRRIPPSTGAQVNSLVLVNNSKHPLMLLAGEIVTGGKQDRVVGKDRVIPAESDPVDLGVFCVEPGRWTEESDHFSTMKSQMAQPSVRSKAMVAQDQRQVWDSVGVANEAAAVGVAGGLAAGRTSYAKTFDDEKVRQAIAEEVGPVEQSYSSLMRQLRDQHAVGVEVAVGGRLIWADIFASTALLNKYWPKLVRSYAAEAITTHGSAKPITLADAQQFLDRTEGTRQMIESEPGVYRQSETIAPNFKLFTLASLLPGTGFDLHISKIADGDVPEVGKLRPVGGWSEARR